MAGEVDLTQNIFGLTPAQIAASRAATQAATSAGATTAANLALDQTTSGLLSLANPLSYIYSFGNFVKGKMDEADARQQIAEQQRQAALEDLIRLGKDPREMYSPEALSANMTDYSWADNPNLTLEDLSGQAIMNAIQEHIAKTGYFPPSEQGSTVTNQLTSPMDYGKDVVDTIGGIFGDPSALAGIVLGPGGVTGNVDWGGGTIKNAPGSAPAVYTGKIGDKVYTGVSTGIPSVDATIRKILGQTEGGETTSMDVLEQTIEDITGYPAGTVSDILESVFKDSGANLPSSSTSTTGGTGTTATTPGGATPSITGEGTEKTSVSIDPDLYQKVMNVIRGKTSDSEIRTAAESAGVSPEEISKVLNIPQSQIDERWEAAGTGVLETKPSVIEAKPSVIEAQPSVIEAQPSVLNNTYGQGPTILDTASQKPVLDVPPSGGGGGGGGGTDLDSLLSGMRGVQVTPGELAKINYLYDIGGESIFAPTMQDEEDVKLDGIPYYSGGQVSSPYTIDELLRILRG